MDRCVRRSGQIDLLYGTMGLHGWQYLLGMRERLTSINGKMGLDEWMDGFMVMKRWTSIVGTAEFN